MGTSPYTHLKTRCAELSLRLRFAMLAGIFWGLLLGMEAFLRAANSTSSLIGSAFLYTLLPTASVSLLLLFFCILLPRRFAAAIVAIILVLLGAYATLECCVKDFFGSYYQLAFVFGMSGQVAGDFGDQALRVFLGHLPLLLIFMLPAALGAAACLVLLPQTQAIKHEPTLDDLLPKVDLEDDGADKHAHTAVLTKSGRLLYSCGALLACILAFFVNVVICNVSADASFYTYNYTASDSMPRFGMLNTLELDLEYSVFGLPTLKSSSQTSGPSLQSSSTDTEAISDTDAPVIEETKIYAANVLNIDFSALKASAANSTLAAMDDYFSSQTPTMQNDYTGYFEGKNLIMICAEAFSYAVIDPELTPMLYRLTTTGFVVENFYQPDWSQSTTGGEFSLMTGIIPTWVNGNTSYFASRNNAMAISLGWQLGALGYSTYAYHNNTYTYYNRDLTHPNMGFTYIGIGNGLDIANVWPASDLDMMEATIPQFIDAYAQNGQNFFTYYMSVSGHAGYSWDGNSKSQKNREVVEDLNYSDTVKAYIACQLELEYALEYLVGALEEAGIAEDTVIVMTPDHYPYGLTEDQPTDYYVELTGVQSTVKDTARYYNTCILWSGCMEEPVVVDTPCTAVDVLPTLYNLFDIDFDSRLFSGRDILADDVAVGEVDTSMNIALFYTSGYGYSWITRAGTFEAAYGSFTPADGVELADEGAYVSAVSAIVQDRFTYATYLISQNYYAHVFPNWSGYKALKDSL